MEIEACTNGSSKSQYYEIELYLNKGDLIEDEEKTRVLKTNALQFQINAGELYECSTKGIVLKCVNKDQGKTLVEECREGICSLHIAVINMAIQIKNMGYYQPEMHRDCVDRAKIYKNCQYIGRLIHAPRQNKFVNQPLTVYEMRT